MTFEIEEDTEQIFKITLQEFSKTMGWNKMKSIFEKEHDISTSFDKLKEQNAKELVDTLWSIARETNNI